MKIIEKYPLSGEYETDARDVWPKRWEAVKELLEKCDNILVVHGYDENEGTRKEVEDELGYT
jgi:hypothetical protein